MWRDEELFDYSIKGQHRTFGIHSVVLAAMSPMFKGMLRTGMGEAVKREGTFPTIPDELMAVVIEFAYTGTCTMRGHQLMGLIEAAHFLQMSTLLQLCQQQIKASMSPDDVFAWSIFASKYQLSAIVPQIDHMKWASYKDIIATEEYQQLTITELMQYLNDVREYGTSCDDILRGVISWIRHDPAKRIEQGRNLLLMFPPSGCTVAFLKEVMDENSELLNPHSKLIMAEVFNKFVSSPLGGDRTILICGGMTASVDVNTTCWKLQGYENQKCSNQENLEKLEELQLHIICRVPNGIMRTGGQKSKMCQMYSLSENKWVKRPTMLALRCRHGAAYVRGKVFVVAGTVNDDSHSVSVDFLDMENDVWQHGPDAPAECIFPKVISFNGNLYVLNTVACAWYRLGEEMTWSTMSSIPKDSFGCSLAASDDRIFAAGGNNNINYMYTPLIDQWCCLTGPSLKERQGSLIYHAQKLYLFPGCKLDCNQVDVEEYDVTTDSWSPSKWKMPQPLYLFGAFLLNMTM